MIHKKVNGAFLRPFSNAPGLIGLMGMEFDGTTNRFSIKSGDVRLKLSPSEIRGMCADAEVVEEGSPSDRISYEYIDIEQYFDDDDELLRPISVPLGFGIYVMGFAHKDQRGKYRLFRNNGEINGMDVFDDTEIIDDLSRHLFHAVVFFRTEDIIDSEESAGAFFVRKCSILESPNLITSRISSSLRTGLKRFGTDSFVNLGKVSDYIDELKRRIERGAQIVKAYFENEERARRRYNGWNE